MEQFSINAIYRATEGEGIHIGIPQIFVRFQGCEVGCINCDSKETWDFCIANQTSFEEVIERIEKEGLGTIKRVSITGGDPEHPLNLPAATMLAEFLKAKKYFINVELAGQRYNPSLYNTCDFLSVDLKTPSTNVEGREDVLEKIIQNYSAKYQIKSVIETREDFDYVVKTRKEIEKKLNTEDLVWILTPAYNLAEKFPMDRFKNIISWNQEEGAKFRVIGQQHKWIYGPDEKLV